MYQELLTDFRPEGTIVLIAIKICLFKTTHNYFGTSLRSRSKSTCFVFEMSSVGTGTANTNTELSNQIVLTTARLHPLHLHHLHHCYSPHLDCCSHLLHPKSSPLHLSLIVHRTSCSTPGWMSSSNTPHTPSHAHALKRFPWGGGKRFPANLGPIQKATQFSHG